MAKITRQGARNVTLDLDKIASLFQQHHDVLAIPEKIAMDFAYRCDLLSDHVERHAISLEKAAAEDEDEEEGKEAGAAVEKPQTEIDDDPKSDDQNKPEHYYGKNAEDETGLSVEPTGGFDPNEIADKKPGPLKAEPGEEGVQGHFTQVNFQQLRGKEEGPGVGTQVDKFATKMAMTTNLSGLVDSLKMMVAKLETSEAADIKSIASNLNKQVKAVSSIHDKMIKQEAAGLIDPMLMESVARMAKAIEEQVPYLDQLLQGADEGSPLAMMNFENLLGGGSIQKLVELATKIVVGAAKAKEVEIVEKAAADDEDTSDDDAKLAAMLEEEGMAAKEAGDDDDDDDKDEDEDEEEDSGDQEDSGKEASVTETHLGYNLFA